MTRVVVLAGSLGSASAMWDAQAAALEGRFAVARHDYPGHGGAPLTDVADVRDLARGVVEQIDARNDFVADSHKVSFVGLSLGGAVGMRIALDAPERLDRLVLACTSARFGEPATWEERARTVRTEGLEAIVDTVLARWFTRGFPDVGRYRAMFLSTDAEGYARCCEALARWDVREQLGRIAAPTLVVSGADDPSTPPEHGELLASRIPGARHVVLPGARHLANVEFAEDFNALLSEHL